MDDLRAAPLSDAEKLEVLALWFDKWDATAYADRQALLNEGPGRHEVQDDLRRIAAALAVVPTEREEIECPDCGGWGYSIGADPLPSGEPGEPYQVPCGTCGSTGHIEEPLDVERLAAGIQAALTIRLIAGNTDQTYTPNEVATIVAAVVDEQLARLRGG